MMVCLFIVTLFLISCSSESNPKSCSLDEDCVPATCCHSTAAVNKEHAQNCRGWICTQECVPGTTDCGQGEIKCVSGSCAIVLNE